MNLCPKFLFPGVLILFTVSSTAAQAGETLPDGFYRYPTIGGGAIVFAAEGEQRGEDRDIGRRTLGEQQVADLLVAFLEQTRRVGRLRSCGFGIHKTNTASWYQISG